MDSDYYLYWLYRGYLCNLEYCQQLEIGIISFNEFLKIKNKEKFIAFFRDLLYNAEKNWGELWIQICFIGICFY